MSIARRLASAVLLSGLFVLVGCGGGGAAGTSAASSTVDEDLDFVILDGREGIPKVDAPVGSEAHVELIRRLGHKSGDKFRVDASGLLIYTTIDIWLEDPTSPATLTVVGSFDIGVSLAGEFLLSTSDGDELPYDVANVSKLVGCLIELRTPAGVLLFAGTVPPLD